jgi:murein L,D-transpeptidase YcbB/YkuD
MRRDHSFHWSTLLLLTFLLMSAIAIPAVLMARPDSHEQVISEAVRHQLEPRVSAQTTPALDWRLLRDFYTPGKFLPVWVDADGPMPRAEQWRHTLEAADREGLKPEDYRLALIEAQWQGRTPAELARLELLLTDAFLKYSVQVRAGRSDPEMIDPLWNITAPAVDAIALLNATLAADNIGSALSGLVPPHPGYRRLREALADYRRLANKGAWPSIPPGPLLKIGQHHPQLRNLRRRLIAEGDLPPGPVTDEALFDAAVKNAVERFQRRHGLRVDGIVGPATRAAMNVRVTERIEQIKLNMERWRWLPRDVGRRYLMVNTAGYELAAVEDNQLRFTARVITGMPERPTPVLRSVIHTVVFNPHWTVPPTIAVEDLLPRQRRNPDYLKSRGIRVLAYKPEGEELDPARIDWSRVDADHFPYILRQDPGPTNPLGRIKFLFSNRFMIYLHDTPERYKFESHERALSSGCIRVSDPLRLASYLLTPEDGWTSDKIEEAIASGESREVAVSQSIPVYLVYLTAWVGEGDAVNFREDIYGQDQWKSPCNPDDGTTH